jgi:hypothetical protein
VSFLIALNAYIALMILLDRYAHSIVYPLVGFGHPLVGARRGLVLVFSPIIMLVSGAVVAVMFPVILLAVSGSSRR